MRGGFKARFVPGLGLHCQTVLLCFMKLTILRSNVAQHSKATGYLIPSIDSTRVTRIFYRVLIHLTERSGAEAYVVRSSKV